MNNIVCMLFLSYSTADLVLFVAVCSTPFRYHFLRRVVVVMASNLQYALNSLLEFHRGKYIYKYEKKERERVKRKEKK